jgi:hypothetical protein
MPSFILDLVKFNEKVDYTFIIPLILGYILLFWLIVSIWVYTDTKKRISKRRYRILFFLLNLIFGLPFLLLYLLARPYDNEESEQVAGVGGINVPIVNFVGKDGILIALELKMSPGTFSPESVQNRDNTRLKVDVSLNTEDDNSIEIKEQKDIAQKALPANAKTNPVKKRSFLDIFKPKKAKPKIEKKEDAKEIKINKKETAPIIPPANSPEKKNENINENINENKRERRKDHKKGNKKRHQ